MLYPTELQAPQGPTIHQSGVRVHRASCERGGSRLDSSSEQRVHVERFLDVAIDGEVPSDALDRPMPHLLSEPTVLGQVLDGVRESCCVVGRRQQARLLLLHHLGERPAAASDDGHATSHRFRKHQAERLTHRGQEEDVRGLQQRFRLGDVPEPADPVRDAQLLTEPLEDSMSPSPATKSRAGMRRAASSRQVWTSTSGCLKGLR